MADGMSLPPCDNERTVALWTDALRAYKGKSSELIPPGPRSRESVQAVPGDMCFVLVFFIYLHLISLAHVFPPAQIAHVPPIRT